MVGVFERISKFIDKTITVYSENGVEEYSFYSLGIQSPIDFETPIYAYPGNFYIQVEITDSYTDSSVVTWELWIYQQIFYNVNII